MSFSFKTPQATWGSPASAIPFPNSNRKDEANTPATQPPPLPPSTLPPFSFQPSIFNSTMPPPLPNDPRRFSSSQISDPSSGALGKPAFLHQHRPMGFVCAEGTSFPALPVKTEPVFGSAWGSSTVSFGEKPPFTVPLSNAPHPGTQNMTQPSMNELARPEELFSMGGEPSKVLPKLPTLFADYLTIADGPTAPQTSMSAYTGGGKVRNRRVAERGQRFGQFHPYSKKPLALLAGAHDPVRPVTTHPVAKPSRLAGVFAGLALGAVSVVVGGAGAPLAVAAAVASYGLGQWLGASQKVEVKVKCPVCDHAVQWCEAPWQDWASNGFPDGFKSNCPECKNTLVLSGFQAEAEDTHHYTGACPNCHDQTLLEGVSLPYPSNWVTCDTCGERSLVEIFGGGPKQIILERVVKGGGTQSNNGE